MDIDGISKLIERFGLAVLILLLILRWLGPKLDAMFSLLMRLAESKTPEGEAKANRAKSKKLYETMETDDKIMRIVRSLITEFRCSRAYVFTYHNGGKNILGMDFARLSCTHEAVAVGIRKQQGHLQGMLITMVWSFVKCINTVGRITCKSVSECFESTDSSVYETLAAQGIKSIYCAALPGEDRVPFGFLGMDYCEEERELTKEEFDRFTLVAERVATILCVSGYPLCGTCGITKEQIDGLD